jgi:hypothetical protein
MPTSGFARERRSHVGTTPESGHSASAAQDTKILKNWNYPTGRFLVSELTRGQHLRGPDYRREKITLEQEIKRSRHARHIASACSPRELAASSAIPASASSLLRNAERPHEIVQKEITKGHKFIILGGGDGAVHIPDRWICRCARMERVEAFSAGPSVINALPATLGVGTDRRPMAPLAIRPIDQKTASASGAHLTRITMGGCQMDVTGALQTPKL